MSRDWRDLLAPPPAHAGRRPTAGCTGQDTHLPGCGCCIHCGRRKREHDAEGKCVTTPAALAE